MLHHNTFDANKAIGSFVTFSKEQVTTMSMTEIEEVGTKQCWQQIEVLVPEKYRNSITFTHACTCDDAFVSWKYTPSK